MLLFLLGYTIVATSCPAPMLSGDCTPCENPLRKRVAINDGGYHESTTFLRKRAVCTTVDFACCGAQGCCDNAICCDGNLVACTAGCVPACGFGFAACNPPPTAHPTTSPTLSPLSPSPAPTTRKLPSSSPTHAPVASLSKSNGPSPSRRPNPSPSRVRINTRPPTPVPPVVVNDANKTGLDMFGTSVTTAELIVIIVGVLLLLLFICACCMARRRRTGARTQPSRQPAHRSRSISRQTSRGNVHTDGSSSSASRRSRAVSVAAVYAPASPLTYGQQHQHQHQHHPHHYEPAPAERIPTYTSPAPQYSSSFYSASTLGNT